MQSALTVFWILSGLGFAIGMVITVAGLARAPEGFEDESGFQLAGARMRPATLVRPAAPVRLARPEHA